MLEHSRISVGGILVESGCPGIHCDGWREPWVSDEDFTFRPGQGYAEFSQLMAHAGLLMERSFPVGMAVMIGDADEGLRRQVKDQICRSGECISWAGWGPLLAVVFRRGLAEELAPVMNEVFIRYPDIRIGVALSEELDNPGDLWLAARLALESAMARRENMVVLDDKEAGCSVAEYRMACAMRRQLKDGAAGFEAHYQPQVLLGSLRPVGVEALARWTWDGAQVPPSSFVPVAEKYGLIGHLGETMLRESARTLYALRADGLDVPKMAVNVSPDQMSRGDFLRMALDTVSDEGLEPDDIELEITESLAAGGGQDFYRGLAELADAGFQIAIDDFGTGMSSLARIREIPATKLKLDRAFVSPLPDDLSGRRICKLAVNLARSLGMVSLAEGVEFPEQASYLRNAGCQLGQGYFWARPMPESELSSWWRARN